MILLKRLFGLPPNPLQLKQQHDVPGLIAALELPFPWIRRDAAQMLGHIKESRVSAPLTAALNDRDSEVRHAAPNTTSRITNKSVSKNGGRTTYRGLVKVLPEAVNATSNVVCDALILDDRDRRESRHTGP